MRFAIAALTGMLALAADPGAQDTAPTTRTFKVVATDGRFEPERLDVSRNDLVQVTLQSTGAPVSFAIDAYRLMKRAGAGEAVTFAFRADQPGRFTFYCSLASNPDCKTMRGTLIVADR
jgi:heme/copper-type cytochrome/quinol oxidase subunit 2